MSKRNSMKGLRTLTVRGMEGGTIPIVSREAQAAVKRLLDRLAQLRRDGEEDLIPIDDVLRNMGVPEEHQDFCAERLSDHLDLEVGRPPETGWELIPRDIVREYVPWPYKGSWLERDVIEWEMIDDLGDDSLNLLNLADLVEQLAESVGAAEDGDIDQAEAKGLLCEIAQHIRAHTPAVCPEHHEVSQAA